MTITGKSMEQISYDCEDLIESLDIDIIEYGKDCKIYAISEVMH